MRLGHPLYLATILGIWKLMGAVVCVIPCTPRLACADERLTKPREAWDSSADRSSTSTPSA
jgi:hypothetical protein